MPLSLSNSSESSFWGSPLVRHFGGPRPWPRLLQFQQVPRNSSTTRNLRSKQRASAAFHLMRLITFSFVFSSIFRTLACMRKWTCLVTTHRPNNELVAGCASVENITDFGASEWNDRGRGTFVGEGGTSNGCHVFPGPLLSPQLCLQRVGTRRARKTTVFGPFCPWFFDTNHSLCDTGHAG